MSKLKVDYDDINYPLTVFGNKDKKKNSKNKTTNNIFYEPTYLEYLIMEINDGNEVLSNFFQDLDISYRDLLEELLINEEQKSECLDKSRKYFDMCTIMSEKLKKELHIDIHIDDGLDNEYDYVSIDLGYGSIASVQNPNINIKEFFEKLNSLEEIKEEYNDKLSEYLKEKEETERNIKKIEFQLKFHNFFNKSTKIYEDRIYFLNCSLRETEREIKLLEFFINLSDEEKKLIMEFFNVYNEKLKNKEEFKILKRQSIDIYEDNISKRMPRALADLLKNTNKIKLKKIFLELDKVAIKASLGHYSKKRMEYQKSSLYLPIIKWFLTNKYYKDDSFVERNMDVVISNIEEKSNSRKK